MRLLEVDSDKGPRIDWCCEEAHQAYLSDAIGFEIDDFCIYSIPPFARRTKRYEPKHYIVNIKYCPFCAAKCEDLT